MFPDNMNCNLIWICISLICFILDEAGGHRTHQVYVNGFWMDRDEVLTNDIKSTANIVPNTFKPAETLYVNNSHGYSSIFTVEDIDPAPREVSFVPAILNHVADPHDIVYLSRFWFEKKISYGNQQCDST